VLPVSSCNSASSVHSACIVSGSSRAAAPFRRAMASPDDVPGAASALMAAAAYML
jgi:hypothetical protein